MYFKLQRSGIGNKPSYIKNSFFRKIPDINARVSKVWAKYKDVPTTILKLDARTNSNKPKNDECT